jgi:NAD(P)-dependent dehydrogenase (short-subunit alcohol dehydrogenase family)
VSSGTASEIGAAAPLAGARVLLTGAGGGLGRAIASGLAGAGAALALHERPGAEEQLQSALEDARAQGARVLGLSADLADSDQVAPLVEDAAAGLDGLDVLVNCAGVMPLVDALDLPLETWERTLAINLTAPMLTAQAAAPVMAATGGGRIVNVTSTRQQQAARGAAAYCASKAGLMMLTRVLALELAPLGIRVNAVAPGTIETPLNAERLAEPSARLQALERIPAGRLGAPEDLVSVVLLLASAQADFITGASFMIDGGQTIW